MPQKCSDFLSIPNWDDLQHYKDRSPPWIKLHNELLESYEFECLPDASKAHLLCIWLLASRTSNKINPDPKWIGRKIGANSKVDIDVLIQSGFLQLNQELPSMEQDASKMLQTVEQVAIPEGEREQSRVEESREDKSKKEWVPPYGLNMIAWSEFEQHRKEIKKPMSDLARTKASNLICNLSLVEQQTTIDKSIASKWPGLFPEKGNQNAQYQSGNKQISTVERSLRETAAHAEQSRKEIADLEAQINNGNSLGFINH